MALLLRHVFAPYGERHMFLILDVEQVLQCMIDRQSPMGGRVARNQQDTGARCGVADPSYRVGCRCAKGVGVEDDQVAWVCEEQLIEGRRSFSNLEVCRLALIAQRIGEAVGHGQGAACDQHFNRVACQFDRR